MKTENDNEFFSNILKQDLLTDEDIKYYLDLYRNGDESARSVLINSNFKLILIVIYNRGYNLSKIDIEDLFQEGVVTLIKSIEACKKNPFLKFYDYTRGQINSKLFKYILSKGKFLKLPDKEATKVYKIIRRQYKIYNFEFNYDKISKSPNLDINAFELSKINLLLSPIENYNDEFIDYNVIDIMSNNSTSMENEFEINDIMIWRKVKKLLTEKQYQVLLLRLGKDILTLKNVGTKRLEECAEILNITPQAVNKLESNAYRKLRIYLKDNKEFKELLYK